MQFVIPILQILIAFQCFIFLLYLLVDSRLSQVPNRVLAALLVTLGTHMLLNLVNQHLIVGLFPNISIGFGFFYGPLIFLYVLALSTRGFALQRVHAAHFVPGLVSSLLAIVFSIPSYYFAIGIFLSLFYIRIKKLPAYFLLSERAGPDPL